MITLFSEEVETTSTNSVHNTLYVESFEEAFFGVYEFEINNTTVIAEQVGSIDGAPVVRMPVVDVDGNDTDYDFVLKKGFQKIELGTCGSVIIQQPVIIEEEVVEEEQFVESLNEDDLALNTETEYIPVTKYNTLWVEGFDEVYFDVYEFVLNGNKVLAEKIDTLGEHPVVRVPFTEVHGNKITADFVLKIGTQSNPEIISEEAIEDEPIMIEGRNTLFVNSYEETFFGVYEFEIGGNKVIAEKIDVVGSYPVVKIPVVRPNGKQVEVEFILRQGSEDSILENSKAVLTEESMSVIKEEDLKDKLHKETKTLIEQSGATDINISYRIDKEEIIEEIKTDSKAALEKLREETKNIVDEVERIRDSIFIEFASNSDTYRAKESKKLQEFVDKKVEELRQTNKVLAEKVERETRNSLESTYGSFIKKLRESQQELKERKKEHQKIASTLNVLEKTQIELRDEVNVNKREILEATEKSEKSVNKALSRLGTVKKELTDSKAEFDTIKDALAHSIMLAEERVKEYYHDKIEEIENTIFDNVRRDEILKVVKESKAKILTELNDTSDIKEQLRVIATEEYDPITGEEFQRKLKKSIDDKFASEMVNIHRMLESYGGGGSGWGSEAPNDGQQYVRQNRSWVAYTDGGGDLSGTGTVGTIPIWDGIKTLGDSIITESGGAVTVGGSAVIGNTSSDTFTVEAESTLNSALSVNSSSYLQHTIPHETVTYDLGSSSRYWRNLYLSGDIYGDVTFQDQVTFDGDVTGTNAYFTSLTALTATFTQTIVSTTSALSIINAGTGPALYVQQDGNEPIAHFIDANGDDIVFNDNGFVGIGTRTPLEKFTVIGSMSSTGFAAASSFNVALIDSKVDNVNAGQIVWNPDEYTFDMGLTEDVTLQVGQEQLMLVKGGENETIRNGMAVYAGGQVGSSTNIQISAFSSNSNFVDELYFLGIATQTFVNEQEGFVNTFGRVRGVNGAEYSSGGIREDGSPEWNVGQILYPSTSLSQRGTLTTVAPVAPNREMPIAWVTAKPNETNMTLMVRSEHGYHLDEIHNVKYDGALQDGQVLSYNSSLSVWENSSEVLNVSSNIEVLSSDVSTLTNNVSALYSYLIQNFDKNVITGATDINDFVTNYPKTGLQPGDVITLSAVNTAYILSNNDGSSLSDWYEVNLKPNFLFYKKQLSDYSVLDTFPLSGAKSAKYIIEVEDMSDGALFYGEVNVVSDGSIAVATEYGLNHTTVFPFVEFGAEVVTGTHIQLSAIALESKNMSNFVFKGNRSNLFG